MRRHDHQKLSLNQQNEMRELLYFVKEKLEAFFYFHLRTVSIFSINRREKSRENAFVHNMLLTTPFELILSQF